MLSLYSLGNMKITQESIIREQQLANSKTLTVALMVSCTLSRIADLHRDGVTWRKYKIDKIEYYVYMPDTCPTCVLSTQKWG